MNRREGNGRLVRRIVCRLQRSDQPTQVILFGLYAHGRPTKDSDADLLIVKRTARPFYRRLFDVRKLISPILQGHPFDPIVVTPKELQRRLAKGDQFLHEVVTKGKLVYGNRN